MATKRRSSKRGGKDAAAGDEPSSSSSKPSKPSKPAGGTAQGPPSADQSKLLIFMASGLLVGLVMSAVVLSYLIPELLPE